MLYVLALLLIIRFILVPILEWQQTQIDSIKSKELQLSKTNHVIDNVAEMNEALQRLTNSNQEKQVRYFEQTSTNAFKLQLQQQVESLFSQYELKITNFSWVTDLPGQISQARAKISFEGSTVSFAKVQIAISQLPKFLNIAQWDLRIVGMNDNKLGKANGSIVLIGYNVAPHKEVK